MGILDVFKPKAKALTPGQLSGLLKLTTANLGIKLDSAYTAAEADEIINKVSEYNVYFAGSIRAILRNIIQPPLKVYNKKTGDDVERPDLLAPIIEPNPWMDYSSFLKFIAFNYIYWGTANAKKLRINDKLKGLLPISTQQIRQKLNADRTAVIMELVSEGKEYSGADFLRWLDSDFGSNYVTGYGMARHLVYTMALNNNADRYNVKSFENGGELKGVLTTEQPLSQEDIDVIQTQLKARYGGADNMGKTAVFGSGIQYSRTGQNNLEMGFEALKKLSMNEVIAITKVPPIELGMYDNANYSNAETQRKLFWETCLIPMLDGLAQTMTKQIIRDEFKEQDLEYYFDFSNIPALREDISQKINTVLTMQMAGYTNEQISNILDIEAPALESAYSISTAPTTASTEPAPKALTAPNIIITRALEGGYKEYVRDTWLKMHGINETPFRRQLEKWVLNQRNAFYDWFDDQVIGKKSALDYQIQLMIEKYFDETKPEDIAKLDSFTYPTFVNINNTAVKRMCDEFRLEFSQKEKTLLTINNHVTKIKRIDATIKDQVLASVSKAVSDWTETGADMGQLSRMVRDYAGRSYNISKDRAFTIARTETSSVANDLLNTQYLENGIPGKRWMTSRDELVRHAHAAAEGETVGATEYFHVGGENLLYPGDMAHGSAGNVINCFVPDTIVQGHIVGGLKSAYSGPVREIKTRGGNSVTITPNHPVLTDRGWVKACEITKGDRLVSYIGDQNRGNGGLIDVNNQNKPAFIKDVFDSIRANGRSLLSMITALDLHGDAERGNGNIDIVYINRKLRDNLNPVRPNSVSNIDLIKSDTVHVDAVSNGALNLTANRIGIPLAASPSAGALPLNKGTVKFEFTPLDTLRLGSASYLNSESAEPSKNNPSIVSGFIGQLFERNAGLIAYDDVVEIRDNEFTGHVYDLQAVDGYIIAHNIICSNCRCVSVPELD